MGPVLAGEDFDAAEDALQEALLEALRVWPEHPPRDPRAWLAAVATRRLVDARRSEAARHRREEVMYAEPRPADSEEWEGDDTLFLLFCCCHPDLAPASQVALTPRAVGGLTTREIADAFYVPEATMAQRISRAKRTLQGRRSDHLEDLAVVLRVLYPVCRPRGRVDLAGEAIRLARQLTLATEEPRRAGCSRQCSTTPASRRDATRGSHRHARPADRGLWDTREIAEGVRVLQSALALQRPGRYQVEAAIAALHDARGKRRGDRLAADPRLVRRPRRPHRRPGRPGPRRGARRAVAVGHVFGAAAGLRRPTGCARCSASGIGGTPSAATCTSSAATSSPPPRRTRMPPVGLRTSPSATTWSIRPPARGPPSKAGTVVSLSASIGPRSQL